jgi:dienelactone hydrolase
MKMHINLRWAAVAAATIVAGLGGSALSNSSGFSIPKRTLDQQVSLIEPFTEILIPDDAGGPVPTLIMFHGCGGLRDIQQIYAEAVLEAGYGVIIVDSNAARGIGRIGSMGTVCAALRLWGQERAADVHAAIKIAANDDRVDATRLALIGWSHGGWTLLEALTYSGEAQLPPTLLDGEPALSGQVGIAILMYPYCGFPVRSTGAHLDPSIGVHAILAEDDLVAPHQTCVQTLGVASRNHPSIQVELWPDITHAFDDPNQAPDPRMEYDAVAAERAHATVIGILDQSFDEAG